MKGSEKNNSAEPFVPPSNLPPGKTFQSRVLFKLRTWVDFQVRTVQEHLLPWLRSRTGNILEVGCGSQPYRSFLNPACRYVGLDCHEAERDFGYNTPDTQYFDGKLFPFKHCSFDNLFHTEVLEHVFAKETFLAECHRVLKPGGKMMFTVPFQARYHYIPNDFWRFTPASLEKLMRNAGFSSVSILPRGNDLTVATFKIMGLFFRSLFSSFPGNLSAILFFLPFPAALLAGHFSLLFSRLFSTDDCLGYTVFATA